METSTAIIITQIPIAIAILIGAYVFHGIRVDLIRILEILAKKK